MFIQMLAATVSIIPFTLGSGGFALPLTVTAVGSVVWLALVGSFAAFVLLFYILKRQPGASATSYLFLVPPGNRPGRSPRPWPAPQLSPAALLGFALAATGVALVTRNSHASARQPLEPPPK